MTWVGSMFIVMFRTGTAWQKLKSQQHSMAMYNILLLTHCTKYFVRCQCLPESDLAHNLSNFRLIFQSLKKEIHRRIDVIPKVVYEPRMINENDAQYIMPPDNHLPIYYCRLKAMDDVKLLGKYIFIYFLFYLLN